MITQEQIEILKELKNYGAMMPFEAEALQDAIDTIESQASAAAPVFEIFCSIQDGDTWLGSPSDIDFVDGLKVGDEYTLLASTYAVSVTYRVTKAPDDKDDNYEVMQINPAPAVARELSDAEEREKFVVALLAIDSLAAVNMDDDGTYWSNITHMCWLIWQERALLSAKGGV